MESVMWGTSARYIIKPQTGNPFAGRNKLREKPQNLGTMFANANKKIMIKKDSGLVEDVSLLVNSLNDQAFLSKSGRIDILKGDTVIHRKFPNMKDASLYLLKSGWTYA
jgi:hypothetical protein